MVDEDGFIRKSTRVAAIAAAKKIKKHAEYNTDKYPFYRDQNVALANGVSSGDYNTKNWRSLKQIKEEQVFEDSSQNISECSNSPRCVDMPKKRRGRPPKLESAKRRSTRSRNANNKDPICKEAEIDVNLRRESYNSFLLNSKPTTAAIFSGPKQLHFGNGGISYTESLMKFTKGLGPTAQKVASRMLQRQARTYQAPRQIEPLLQPPDAMRNPHLMDVNSINGLVKNTITNQVNQPLMVKTPHQIEPLFQSRDAIANYKGKKTMVDDGKNNFLEFLFDKPKSGVKIGNGLLEKKDFGNKNLDYAQGGNQTTINKVGSFWSKFYGNLNQNATGQKEPSWSAFEGTPSKGKQISSSVHPSTYLRRSQNVSGSSLGFDGEVSRFSWVAHPPKSPAVTNNSVVNDNFLKDNEFQLSLAPNMEMKDHESRVWSRNVGGSSQVNQFRQAHAYGPDREQIQERFMIPTPQQFWSHMVTLGAKPGQDALPFGTQQDFGFQMGKNFLHPPPSI